MVVLGVKSRKVYHGVKVLNVPHTATPPNTHTTPTHPRPPRAPQGRAWEVTARGFVPDTLAKILYLLQSANHTQPMANSAIP